MVEATRYREKAAELRETAAQMENFEVRDELLIIAQQYDDLASAIEAAAEGASDRGLS